MFNLDPPSKLVKYCFKTSPVPQWFSIVMEQGAFMPRTTTPPAKPIATSGAAQGKASDPASQYQHPNQPLATVAIQFALVNPALMLRLWSSMQQTTAHQIMDSVWKWFGALAYSRNELARSLMLASSTLPRATPMADMVVDQRQRSVVINFPNRRAL